MNKQWCCIGGWLCVYDARITCWLDAATLSTYKISRNEHADSNHMSTRRAFKHRLRMYSTRQDIQPSFLLNNYSRSNHTFTVPVPKLEMHRSRSGELYKIRFIARHVPNFGFGGLIMSVSFRAAHLMWTFYFITRSEFLYVRPRTAQ